MSAKNYLIKGPVSPAFIARQIEAHNKKHGIGAHALFLGQVRADEKEGATVTGIAYSAYEEMANKEISRIREEAFDRHNLSCLHVYHSTGFVPVGALSLFIFVSSAHRREALQALEEIVEKIKYEVPVWKEEHWSDGSRVFIEEERKNGHD
ncbi:MAG: molybdenum cofactor biosynthesis protein MoaE [Calditrichaeota bacterium]|nr:MAG: molybdenum cofactor biosynthesis protein MoaE [Calditrichota bacterium]